MKQRTYHKPLKFMARVGLVAVVTLALGACSSVYRDDVKDVTAQQKAEDLRFDPPNALEKGIFHMQRVNDGSTVVVKQEIKLKHPDLPPFDVAYVSRDVQSVLLELANAAGESIVIPSSLRGKTVTVIHSGADFQQMLDIVLDKIGYSYNYIDGVWYITRYPVRTYQLEITQGKRGGSLSSIAETGIEESDTSTKSLSSSNSSELDSSYDDKLWTEVSDTLNELAFVGSQTTPKMAENGQTSTPMNNTSTSQGFTGGGQLTSSDGSSTGGNGQVELLEPPTIGDSGPSGGSTSSSSIQKVTIPQPVATPQNTDFMSPDDLATPFMHITQSTGTIVVRAAPEAHRLIKKYLEQVQQALMRQIFVEARIVAVVDEKDATHGAGLNRAIGTNIAGAGSSLATIGFTAATDPTNSSTLSGGFLNLVSGTGDLSLVMKLLSSIGNVYTLSSPSVLARNNQVSRVSIIKQLGYDETTVQTNTNANGDTVLGQRTDTAKFKNAGTVFSLIPFIGRTRVQMRMRLTISSQSGSLDVKTAIDADPNNAVVNSVPELTTNLIDQDIVMDYGRVYAVGGLIQTSTTNTTSYMPGFDQLPGMRDIFRQSVKTKGNTEFLVLMRVSRA